LEFLKPVLARLTDHSIKDLDFSKINAMTNIHNRQDLNPAEDTERNKNDVDSNIVENQDDSDSNGYVMEYFERANNLSLKQKLFFAMITGVMTWMLLQLITNDMYSHRDERFGPRKVSKHKVVDVNGPPNWNDVEARNFTRPIISRKTTTIGGKATSSTSRKKKKPVKFKSTHSKRTVVNEDEAKPLTVVNANDDQIPMGLKDSIFGTNMIHASEALECRSSVISFVINATDAKDECDGLKRAFDKTCNSDGIAESSSQQDAARKTERPESDGRRHRRLLDASCLDTLYKKWVVLAYETSRWFHTTFVSTKNPDFEIAFFSEDEVMGEAWKNGEYLVLNNIDHIVHESTVRRLKSRKRKRVPHFGEKPEREHHQQSESGIQEVEVYSEDNTTNHDLKDADISSADYTEVKESDESVEIIDEDNSVEEIQVENQEEQAADISEQNHDDEKHVTKDSQKKTMHSLTLPTSNHHISETMLSETLLLQHEDSILKAIEVIANQTNVTMNEAAIDAATSTKAVQDASAAVSAVLNDPTSVEARTCCASILNVFHENCDAPEEEVVSDKKLFVIVFVLAFCGMVKSLIRNFQIKWLPEAAGCILVGGKYKSHLLFCKFNFT
jgi:hypothetical protein